jgi:predicted NBD/HSP70 family sugar kinase
VTRAGAVVALDVGGTHVSAATVDVGSAAVVSASRVRTELVFGSPREELLDRLRDTATAARQGDAVAAGVAVPGPFDYARGVCLLEHKLESLYGVDLRAELAVALSLAQAQVRFVNDAEAFLLGEWWAGAARGHDRAMGITLGTGLGSAFLEHGRIVHTGAGVPREGALYRLPFRGAPVEERISRGALLARYGEADIDVAEIALRARGGEPRAREAFDTLANDLAAFLRPWLEAFAPSCLVVGGLIARSWDLLESGLDPLRDTVAALVPADRIDEAALLGAARHAVTEGAA